MYFKHISRIHVIVLFLTSTIVSVNLGEAQQFVTDGLVAFYTLDKADIEAGVVKDVSGNGNDAKIMGTNSPSIVTAKIGQSLQLDGKKVYVEIPRLGEMEQASVECWALRTSFDGENAGVISTFMWEAGKVHFKFQKHQNITVHKHDGVKLGEAFKFDVKTWYHIIYTCDTKADKLSLYINGKWIQDGKAGKTPQNMDERRIGSEHDGRFLHGIVDEVRIYNRILNEKEALQNFKATNNSMVVEASDKLAVIWASIKSER